MESSRFREELSALSPRIVAGLPLLLSTLLFYSAPNTLFVASENMAFIELFSLINLIATIVCALVITLFALRNTTLSRRVLLCVGLGCYLLGGASYCLLILTGLSQTILVVASAVINALGSLAVCLIWGRVCSRLHLRAALVALASAVAASAVLFWILLLLPETMRVVVFFLAMLSLAVLSWLEMRGSVSSHVGKTRNAPEDRGLAQVKSLAQIAGIPALGLAFFAFVVAVMRDQFLTSFNLYLVASIVVAAIIIVFVLLSLHTLTARGLQLTFIPLFAVCVLTAASLQYQLGLDEKLVMLLLFVLYVCAALLTLSTMTAVANSGEFHPDIVFGSLVFLFTAASTAGQLVSRAVASTMVGSINIIATTLFSFIVICYAYVRWQKSTDISEPADETASVVDSETDGIQASCAKLAAKHGLTGREREILILLAYGHGGSYISEALFISPSTSRTHIRNIYRKLAVNSREDILRITRE
ncbi:MAG: helix-turn-helix transcriptional regulator [Coriobacteriales bacterium]|jgi:DNA-binding CsgD family transcriptional regulator|nr:helix-turn-helix transcriptional regulator [Coriobacteriales bacterium]